MKSRILVVAGDLTVRAAVARILQSAGHAVELAADEKRSRELSDAGGIDAAIVAPSTLGAGGQKLTAELQGSIDRVIVLADDANSVARLSGSFPGAMVLPHPLDRNLLLARLSDLLVPAKDAADVPAMPELLRFDGQTVDLAGRTFHDADGREVSLTHAEFQLLAAFIRRPGRVLSRDQLRNAVAGRNSELYDRSIDMLVARLRRKIETDPKAPRFILTVPGEGYKFAARPQRAEPAAPPARAEREPRESSMANVERRQITVLACQISSYGALAAKHDPEDVHAAMTNVYQVVTDLVKPFCGMIARTLGDGVLIYFGYPEAHEDDAERAVRAALNLVKFIPSVDVVLSTRLHLRVGIATGVMLVGGAETSPNHSAVGEPLNLALQLRSAAPPDGVVIAAGTRELIGRFFDCEELKPVTLEEGLEPVPVWRVMGEGATASGRFDALRRAGMLELVGREEQMELLIRRWHQAQRGAGQVIVLTGEPGIGKSRLAAELEARVAAESDACLKYFGLPHQTDASMFAVISELQSACHFERADTAPDRVRKLEAVLRTAGVAAPKNLALVADLLSLPTDLRQSIGQLSSHERKKETFAALRARVEGLATRRPMLMIVEDLHWIDPASLEFLALARRAQRPHFRC